MARRGFNRSQKRDRNGRWTKGGSSGGSKKKTTTVYTQYTSLRRDGTVKSVGPVVARDLDRKGRFKAGRGQKIGASVGAIAGLAVGAASGVFPVAAASAAAGSAVGGQIGFRFDERARIKRAQSSLKRG